MNIIKQFTHYIRQLLNSPGFNIRTKLIIILVVTMVIPLILLTFISLMQVRNLGKEVFIRANELENLAYQAVTNMGSVAMEDSIKALNNIAIVQLERTSTDIAKQVAGFLYDRDDDILFASELVPNEEAYKRFLKYKTRNLIKKGRLGT